MSEEMIPFQYFASDYIRQLTYTLGKIDSRALYRAVQAIQDCKGTVWLVGNGGSATLASHMATDLQLAKVRAYALTDVAAITTYANDHGYDYSLSDQVDRLVRPGDVLIAISGRGSSINIRFAAQAAHKLGAKVIAVTGFDGGSMGARCDIHLNIPVAHMGQSQDGHQIILHIICYYLMEKLKNETTCTNRFCTCSRCRPQPAETTCYRPLVGRVHGIDDDMGSGVL